MRRKFLLPIAVITVVFSSVLYAKEARQLLEAGLQNPASINRLYTLPPGTPKARVELLRKAFMATMKDPKFLAEIKKAKLEINPVSGQEVRRIVTGFFTLKPETLAKLKKVLVPEK